MEEMMDSDLKNYSYKSDSFAYCHCAEEIDNSNAFKLHNHNDFVEVLLFIRGDSKLIVEGSTYDLSRNSIAIENSNEMHRVVHNNPGIYERVVFNCHYKFFSQNQCNELKNIFTQRKPGFDNLLHFEDEILNQILNLCKKFDFYLSNYNDNPLNKLILNNLTIELMYLLNMANVSKSANQAYDQRIQKIMIYINENLSEKLSLDLISGNFFLNKYYLCRMFKKYTGFTVNEYISYKRLIYARTLYNEGKTLIDASLEAGFESYSNFYKSYVKQFGISPRNQIK